MSNYGAKADLYQLGFLISPEHECGYLSDRDATTLFLDPETKIDSAIFSYLSAQGFRRSGEYLYRPHCQNCQACIPVRIPVSGFKPSRSQRRNRNLNRDLQVSVRPACFDPRHFALYQRYIEARHPGCGMETDDPQRYLEFFTSKWSETSFCEFRLDNQLIAVVVVDKLPDALSAVYSFYDPDLSERGLGSYSILWLIEEARRAKLPWVYLGYWIAQCDKMSYKVRYRPLETYVGERWRRINRGTQPPTLQSTDRLPALK